MKHSWASYSGTLRRLILAAQPPPELTQLRAPLWLIAGREDEVLDLDHLKELAGTDRVQLEVWPGGHDLPLSDAARSVEVVEAMLASRGEVAVPRQPGSLFASPAVPGSGG